MQDSGNTDLLLSIIPFGNRLISTSDIFNCEHLIFLIQF